MEKFKYKIEVQISYVDKWGLERNGYNYFNCNTFEEIIVICKFCFDHLDVKNLEVTEIVCREKEASE